MIALDKSNFTTETAQGVTLVDFYANWCSPCRMLTPILEQLQDVKVCKVDIDSSQDLAVEYAVTKIPCIVFFKDGKEVDRTFGLVPKNVLQSKVDALNAKTP